MRIIIFILFILIGCTDVYESRKSLILSEADTTVNKEIFFNYSFKQEVSEIEETTKKLVGSGKIYIKDSTRYYDMYSDSIHTDPKMLINVKNNTLSDIILVFPKNYPKTRIENLYKEKYGKPGYTNTNRKVWVKGNTVIEIFDVYVYYSDAENEIRKIRKSQKEKKELLKDI